MLSAQSVASHASAQAHGCLELPVSRAVCRPWPCDGAVDGELEDMTLFTARIPFTWSGTGSTATRVGRWEYGRVWRSNVSGVPRSGNACIRVRVQAPSIAPLAAAVLGGRGTAARHPRHLSEAIQPGTTEPPRASCTGDQPRHLRRARPCAREAPPTQARKVPNGICLVSLSLH